MLPEEVEKIEGGHNYRQVLGFPVFGVGQPSKDGMKNILEKVKASRDDKSNQGTLFLFVPFYKDNLHEIGARHRIIIQF